ncbi:MAG TPA: Ig-like domain-containing protein [Longimicrobiales bacterium]|nr:Ig-like domain-containing protein [Longimicrobiales bacterium]
MRSFAGSWGAVAVPARGGKVKMLAGVVVAVVALAAAACTDPHTPLTFAKIEIDGGNNQTGKVCTALPQQLVVSAWDQFGNPLPGALIRFEAQEGTVSPATALAGADGRVRVEYTLGSTPGPVTVRALAWNDQYRVDFEFTAEPDPPLEFRRTSGHNQRGPIGTALANPLVARVTDACGEPVSDFVVQWTTTGGVLGSAESSTDEEGFASNTLTLPAQPGQLTITATATGIGSVTFTATADEPDDED